MKKISQSGELQSLAAERVWREFEKGLSERSPQSFVHILYQCDALTVFLPELDQRFHHHDNLLGASAKIGDRTLAALHYAAGQQMPTPTRWAITLHAVSPDQQPKNILAKGLTTTQHTSPGADAVNTIGERLRAPNDYTELASLSANYLAVAISAMAAKPDLIVDLLDACDVWRRPERFEQFLLSCEAIIASQSNKASAPNAIPFLRSAADRCSKVSAKAYVEQGISGPAVGESMRNERKILVAQLKKQFEDIDNA